ncbi:hypothetical protein TESG_03737 [Trichophyton tonsurans CBS 112818]|uniref:F-box domain-containing protein n=1 Tax=Trichophyton tonsurans (strain CBS 112818) TaxID=647933 RepID=F2RY85_TRIT1|nr:hypothetical protein TESG_03737 [Trichophyton tonsurans CBS 112818]
MGLLTIPVELLDEITGYLSYSSWFALSLTCRTLHTWIDNPYCTSKKRGKPLSERLSQSRCPMIKPRDLFEIEMWPGYLRQANIQMAHAHGYFACGECVTLRRARHFTNAMMKGKRGKTGSGTIEQRSKRVCIQCCLRLGRFSPGTTFYFGGAEVRGYGIFCSRCLRYEEYVRHEEHEGYDYSNMSGTCGRSWHYPGYQKSAEDYHAEARYYSQFAAYYARPPF